MVHCPDTNGVTDSRNASVKTQLGTGKARGCHSESTDSSMALSQPGLGPGEALHQLPHLRQQVPPHVRHLPPLCRSDPLRCGRLPRRRRDPKSRRGGGAERQHRNKMKLEVSLAGYGMDVRTLMGRGRKRHKGDQNSFALSEL